MFDEKHVYEAIMAETYLKGEANGIEKEREKNEIENAARDSRREKYLRSQNIPDDVISAMLALK